MNATDHRQILGRFEARYLLETIATLWSSLHRYCAA